MNTTDQVVVCLASGMRNELSGRVSGVGNKILQINKLKGDVVLGDNTTAAAGRRRRGNRSSSGKSRNGKPGGGFAVFLLAAGMGVGIIQSCDSGTANIRDTAFPSAEQGSRPGGVSDDAVARLVTDKLRSCATEVVLAPVNCPQAHSAQSAHRVRWELVGNPHDGMQVVWHNDRFFARGTAVMTVNYVTAHGGPDTAIEAFHFQTEVTWRGDETRIDSVYRPRTPPPPGTIRKERFRLAESDLPKAVREGFTACTAVTTSPMPPVCPRTLHTPALGKARWSLEADPLMNWASAQDAEFGLVRVTASYSAALHTDHGGSSGTPFFIQSGNYEATLVRTPNKTARLLGLRHR
jgi:hypothetical protein